MESDFILITLRTFRYEAEAEQELPQFPDIKQIKEVLLPHSNPSLSEVCMAYDQIIKYISEFPKVFRYIISLLIIKLSEESPLPKPQGLVYFKVVQYFIENFTEYEQQALTKYCSGLIQEIITADRETLFLWIKEISAIITEPALSDAVKVLLLNLTKCYYSDLNKMITNFSKKSVSDLLDTVDYIIFFDNSKNYMADQALSIIYHEINENCELDLKNELKNNIIDEIADAKEIIQKTTKFFNLVSAETRKIYKLILDKLKSSNKKLPFIPEELRDHEDISHLNIEEKSFYHRNLGGKSQVYGYRGNLGQSTKLIIKYYVDCLDNEVLRESIKKENEILIYLSNRRHIWPAFLKYYGGKYHENNSFLLYMEDGGENLMDFISKRKREARLLDKFTIERWIKDLIKTFSWLSEQCIIHRDIKPHNLLVSGPEEYLTLKIIDFSVTNITNEPETSLVPTQSVAIQGTKGYIAPELYQALEQNKRVTEHKPGKADVFSLGLTILQFITFEDLSGMNKPELNEFLISKKVGVINQDNWVKDLLTKMLQVDPRKRLSFNKCLACIRDDTLSLPH